ncbi:exodeoxyribonuclease VII large subunit [Alicyclobacillus fastidiosus]|uniref:Exodeoxyribonuclease 7 large subunit n=1 Tax=Alicyclobacillus fastidiosus TaxID=392011 RepID=A0ABV5AFZ1_9BACL|nr:exodeoxyribonuclease VII large subunit [Alicyclobacillus fastidiosus]WEH11721.1 exodeoxyribonuclease VII large subunit [Alicyclobacillus fastidiosus]
MNAASPAAANANVFSVTQLNRAIKDRLETDPNLLQCHVSGEISNFKHHTSGHMYFTLKDEQSRVRAVMFAGRNRRLRFRPEDGMRVVCTGSVSVFDRDGQYQLYVDDMQPDGIGALYVQFEQLRNRLQAEGLFSQVRKRPLPAYPTRIGVVTSPTGAVIRDICTTIERRFPLAKVILAPAAVQGAGAAKTLVAGLRRLWSLKEPVDVIIIGRGGGSLEELWPFNEEVVARAVANSPIPVVSAVGHETDVTICDFVADVRAATPTAAAELVAPHRQDMNYQLTQALARSVGAITNQVRASRQVLRGLAERPVLREPKRMIDKERQSVDYVEGRLRDALVRPVRVARRQYVDVERRLLRVDLKRRIDTLKYQTQSLKDRSSQSVKGHLDRSDAWLERQIGVLEAMNPLSVLRRGYSVVYDESKDEIISSTAQLPAGRRIRIRVADGTVSADVVDDGGVYTRGEQTRLDI